MRNLFNIKDEFPSSLLKYGQRVAENTAAAYVGTGRQVMALLRTNEAIRKEKRVLKIIEPDGFQVEITHFEDHKRSVKVNRYMDLNVYYILYTRQGWEKITA